MNYLFSRTPAQLVRQFRVSMEELPDINKIPERYDLFQLKMDGWWVVVKILGQEMQIITSGADIRKTYKIDNPLSVEAILIGEWMYGTNWSGKHNSGQIYIHDIVHWEYNGKGNSPYCNGELMPYIGRLKVLNEIEPLFESISPLLEKLLSYEMDTLTSVWNDTPDYEGVVLKSSHSGLGTEMQAAKIKREYTEDYVVMGITEGAGRLVGKMGALEGGLYVDGKLTSICSVGGGFSDILRAEIWNDKEKYLGKVFEAHGKGKFAGGALRHPNFFKWREDKLPTQCVRR